MTTAGEMDEAPCPMAGRGVTHAPHGFMGAKVSDTTAPPAPVFLRCPGVPDGAVISTGFEAMSRYEGALASGLSEAEAQAEGWPEPERADREGDSQPLPVGTDELDTQSVAMALIDSRRELGVRRYGQPLQPSNGRDSLWDAVEEALDQFVYLVNYWRQQNPDKPVPGLELS